MQITREAEKMKFVLCVKLSLLDLIQMTRPHSFIYRDLRTLLEYILRPSTFNPADQLLTTPPPPLVPTICDWQHESFFFDIALFKNKGPDKLNTNISLHKVFAKHLLSLPFSLLRPFIWRAPKFVIGVHLQKPTT